MANSAEITNMVKARFVHFSSFYKIMFIVASVAFYKIITHHSISGFMIAGIGKIRLSKQLFQRNWKWVKFA